MADNKCEIMIENTKYNILKNDLEILTEMQEYCQKITGRKIDLSNYERPNLFNNSQYARPKIGIYIDPFSDSVSGLQMLSCKLKNAAGMEKFDNLTYLDLRNNKLKGLPVNICDILYSHKGKVYVSDNLIRSEAEHGTKSAGLFSSWILNKKYSTMDFDLFKLRE